MHAMSSRGLSIGNRRALLVLPLALLALVMGIGLAPVTYAASAPGAVSFSPTNGPIGTQVTVTINPPAGTYTLGATTTPPSSGGCATSRSIPGVAPIPVGGSGGGMTFAWPSAFGQGSYWLCARLQSTGATTSSSVPFVVTVPSAPTPTPTSPPANPATITIHAPAGGAVAGTHITLQITGWSDRTGEAPDTVDLVNVDPATTQILTSTNLVSTTFTITAQDNAGNYTLSVSVPAYTTAGQYWVHVMNGASGVFSHTSFHVLAAPLKIVTRDMSAPHAQPGGFTEYLPFAILALVVLIAAIGVFLVSRAGRPTPTPAPSRAPPDRRR